MQPFYFDRKPNITGCETWYFDRVCVRVCVRDTLVRDMCVSRNVNVGEIDSDTRVVLMDRQCG